MNPLFYSLQCSPLRRRLSVFCLETRETLCFDFLCAGGFSTCMHIPGLPFLSVDSGAKQKRVLVRWVFLRSVGR